MRTFVKIVVVLALIHAPQAAFACSICMGDPNSNVAKGANAAIFLMLGVLVMIFGLIGAFALHLHRRSKSPAPPHAELGEMIATQPETGLR